MEGNSGQFAHTLNCIPKVKPFLITYPEYKPLKFTIAHRLRERKKHRFEFLNYCSSAHFPIFVKDQGRTQGGLGVKPIPPGGLKKLKFIQFQGENPTPPHSSPSGGSKPSKPTPL